MAGVTIKKGDRLPVLARQFTLDGGAINLTGSTVIFDMWNASTGAQVITAGAATITGAATGDVEYAWTSADATLVAGQYLGAFTASFSGRTRFTLTQRPTGRTQATQTRARLTWFVS